VGIPAIDQSSDHAASVRVGGLSRCINVACTAGCDKRKNLHHDGIAAAPMQNTAVYPEIDVKAVNMAPVRACVEHRFRWSVQAAES
jgi:hypothetical protein